MCVGVSAHRPGPGVMKLAVARVAGCTSSGGCERRRWVKATRSKDPDAHDSTACAGCAVSSPIPCDALMDSVTPSFEHLQIHPELFLDTKRTTHSRKALEVSVSPLEVARYRVAHELWIGSDRRPL